MKKSVLFIMAIFASLWVYSQNQNFYAYFKQNYAASSGKIYYSGSLLPLKAEVSIATCSDGALKDTINKQGGIKVGATFPIHQFGSEPTTKSVTPKDVNNNDIRFKTNNPKLRYAVNGVTLNPIYQIGKDTIKDFECFLIVPETLVDKTKKSDSLIKVLMEALERFERVDTCIAVKDKERFGLAKYALLYENEVGPSHSLSDDDNIYLFKKNNAKPTAISFAFSDDKDSLFIQDFSLLIGNFDFENNQTAGSEKTNWYVKNDGLWNPLFVLVICAGVFVLWRWKNKKKDKDENDTPRVTGAGVGVGGDGDIKNNDNMAVKNDHSKGTKKEQRNIQNQRTQKGDQKKDADKGIITEMPNSVVSEISNLLEARTYELLEKFQPVMEKIEVLGQNVSGVKTQLSNSKLDQVQTKLVNLENSVSSIKTLVSNTNDKKTIEELSGKLKEKETESSNQKEKLKEAERTITERNKTIETLNSNIDSLQNQLDLPNTEIVKGAERFISFAQGIIATVSNAENKVVSDWMSISDVVLKERASYFIANEQASRPTKDIERWLSILSTLKLKSVISDSELVKYVKTVAEEERATYITKQFIGSVVVPLVSCALILLEQFRTGKEWGYAGVVAESYAASIKEIIAMCKNEGIEVDYCRMYENLSNYENVEIDDTVPAPVSEWINLERKDVVLYVKNYSVSSNLLNDIKKTSCVVAF